MTVTVPAGAPVVFKGRGVSAAEMLPAGRSPAPTVTETLSGLVQVQLMVVAHRSGRWPDSPSQEICGGSWGWLFDREFEVQLASLFFFALGSVSAGGYRVGAAGNAVCIDVGVCPCPQVCRPLVDQL